MSDANLAPFFVVVPKKKHRPKTGMSGVLSVIYTTRDGAMRGLAKRTAQPDEWHIIEVMAWQEIDVSPSISPDTGTK